MVKSKRNTGIYLKHLVSGDITYYMQYINEDGDNTKVKIGRKSDGINEAYCSHKRSETINQIRLGENPIFRNKKGPTVDEVKRKYFISLSNNGNSEYSTKNEQQRYTKHIAPLIGDKSVYSITIEILNKMKHDKMETLAPKTINNILELISCILNHGINELDLKIVNNIANGKVKKFKLDNQRQRFLNKEEVLMLLGSTTVNHKVDLATRLALSTGARLATLLSIQKKHIDKVNRMVTLKDHKNNSTYTSFLPECYFENFDFLIGLKANDHVISDAGNMINKTTIQKPFKKIADRLFNVGLASDDRNNRVVFHSLRHTYCSLLAINNVPIFTIQKLVNHRDIKSTLRYAKLDRTTMFEAVESSFS